MKFKHYTVGDLRSILKESNEFSPKLGKNVTKDNEKNNKEAYNLVDKKMKEYGSFSKKDKDKKTANYPITDNRGQEDIEYVGINDTFKKRVASQKKGYTSDNAEKLHKNDPYGNADFDTIKGIDDKAKEIKKGRDMTKGLGISGKNDNKISTDDYKKQRQLATENKMTKLKFKNTFFITEHYMMTRIPDSFKVEGKKFIMEDKYNNQYLVEWHEEKDPFVMNKTKLNEERKRIKELFNYKRGESNTTNNIRLTEDKNVKRILDITRKLMQ